MNWIRRNAPALWALAGGVAMAVISAYVNARNGDDYITSAEFVQIAVQAAGVVVVWLAANVSSWPRVKAWVLGAMAVLNGLVSVIDGGLTALEVANLVIAFLSAAGVAVTPGPVARELPPART